MTITPFERNHAIVNPQGKIVEQSPNVKQAVERYLTHPDTKANDPIRIVVASVPSKTNTTV